MYDYLNCVEAVLNHGEKRITRNGGTRSLFGTSISHNLVEGFPLLTTKRMNIRSVASELAWILSGSRDERYLAELNKTERTIWTANADSYQGDFPGDVGFIYGPKLRDFHGVDQLQEVVRTLTEDPTSRRMVVTMLDPSETRQCLPVCHHAWQIYVRDKEFLDLKWAQRSVDVGLGLPYDLAHYSLLNILLARTANLTPGIVIGEFGDTHIYETHVDELIKQLNRTPFDLPHIFVPQYANVFDWKIEDIELINYRAHAPLKMEMIV